MIAHVGVLGDAGELFGNFFGLMDEVYAAIRSGAGQYVVECAKENVF